MTNLERSTRLGLGLSVLLVSAGLRRPEAARAQTGPSSNPQRPATEPTEDPGETPANSGSERRSSTPEDVIRKWPKGPRVAARALISKYGQPDAVAKGSLIWRDRGDWKEIAVYGESLSHFFGERSKDYLKETVAYEVPAAKIEDLKSFDERISVNEGRGLLSASSESEAQNFLALNLADEIVTEKRSVNGARDFLAKTERLAKAGKSSAYTQGFLFRPATEAPADERQDIYDKTLTP